MRKYNDGKWDMLDNTTMKRCQGLVSGRVDHWVKRLGLRFFGYSIYDDDFDGSDSTVSVSTGAFHDMFSFIR